MGDTSIGITILIGLVLVLAGMAMGWLLHSSRSLRRKYDAEADWHEQQLAERRAPRHAYTVPRQTHEFSSLTDG